MANMQFLDTVKLSADEKQVVIVDQTLLPNQTKFLYLDRAEDMREAIVKLRVRGAPAIGVMAALSYAVLAGQIQTEDGDEFVKKCRQMADYLNSARPTAVNLSWALNRMHAFLLSCRADRSSDVPVAELKDLLRTEAKKIYEEDIKTCRAIGSNGFQLLDRIGKGAGILTHCNAGSLATAKYGTALAPIYLALEHGWDPKKDLHVYCDETRPLLQGARLSAYEMQNAGVDTTVQCDNMAAYTMQSGKVDIVFVGCDRVAANGDFANKIGTSGVAILAKYYGIPFYVCAPLSTIDLSLPSGKEIPIEQRDPAEVTEMWYKKRMAPDGVNVLNPAFDVTDHSLVTGFVTEKGIARAPFREEFEKMFAV